MTMADPLIRTKLRRPFIRAELVSRPRLQEQVALGLRGPLTLITAPAGFGKTTLVVAGLAGCGLPVAWLSLDRDDNQPGRFLTYLIAALQEVDRGIGGEAAQMLAASPQGAGEAALPSLINDLDRLNQDMALVLDDYQFISSQAVHQVVAILIEHCPRTFHLVIATRSDPPLPLARLRARGQTVELRAADLRFTETEAAEFINERMGIGLDAGSIAVLEERTEGWIAGLQMAALSLRGRADVDSFLRAFAGTNRFIMDFMLEEVLAHETEAVQAFLLQTAVLTRLAGPLCDALTGARDGQEMLEGLEKRNLFIIPLDDERRWYRYHHLFADLLKAKLNRAGPEQSERLLARAAAWCEQAGLAAEAVGYALAARDFNRAARLVERYWLPMTNNGEIETVWTWLNVLPEETVRDNALLGVAYCSVLWLMGQTDQIEAHLVDAERAASRLDAAQRADPEYVQLPAILAALRSLVARYQRDFESARDFAEQAHSLVPAGLAPSDEAQLHGLVFLALAVAYEGAGDLERAAAAYDELIRNSRRVANATGLAVTYRLVMILQLLGRLRAAETASQEALRYLEDRGLARLPAAGVLHVALGEVLVEQNYLKAAQAQLARGSELGKWSGRLDAVRNAPLALARLRLASHDSDGALAAVQEAETALGEQAPALAKAGLLAAKARILIRQGAPGEAARCMEEAVFLAGRDRGQVGEMVRLVQARLVTARCEPEEAAAQVTHALAAAESRGLTGVAIELLILRSLARQRQGSRSEGEADQAALDDLERALSLAEPEGYARIFLEEGQPMQALLARWLAQAASGRLRDFAAGLLAQFEAEQPLVPGTPAGTAASGNLHPVELEVRASEPQAQSGNERLIEPLSFRELEVLRLMATGMTNQEIARRLVVAPGTIKAHAASIYRKLDVANRTQAVARARELDIIA